jgi:hypothetical protein
MNQNPQVINVNRDAIITNYTIYSFNSNQRIKELAKEWVSKDD